MSYTCEKPYCFYEITRLMASPRHGGTGSFIKFCALGINDMMLRLLPWLTRSARTWVRAERFRSGFARPLLRWR
jgi:hypothetical protein